MHLGPNFLVGVEISMHGSFDLRTSGVRQLSSVAYTRGATGVTPA